MHPCLADITLSYTPLITKQFQDSAGLFVKTIFVHSIFKNLFNTESGVWSATASPVETTLNRNA